MQRRFFLFAAPAIVAAPSLMRVSTVANLFLPPKRVLFGTALFAPDDVAGFDATLDAARYMVDILRKAGPGARIVERRFHRHDLDLRLALQVTIEV